MNYIQTQMNRYSQDFNDYAAYLAPLGAMTVSAAATGKINLISSFAASILHKPSIKLAEKLEKEKDLINKTSALFASTATAITLSHLFAGNKVPLTLALPLSFLGAAVAQKAIEKAEPARVVPYLPLPGTIAISCVMGEIASSSLGNVMSKDAINAMGMFGTAFGVLHPTLNELFPEKTQEKIRYLTDGRFIKDGIVYAQQQRKAAEPKQDKRSYTFLVNNF